MDSEVDASAWVRLTPPFAPTSRARRLYVEHAARLAEALRLDLDDLPGEIRRSRESGLAAAGSCRAQDQAPLRAAVHVTCDLALQRWRLRVDERHVEAAPPRHLRDPAAARAEVRRQELIKRDEQLAAPPVQHFVRAMELARPHGARFVSVFNLMRDGRELAASLERARAIPDVPARAAALKEVVDPYLQVVADEEICCELTGLRLMDIWS